MEELNLKKAIKELKKQIKEKEKRCEEIEALVEKQKEEDEKEKQFQYGEIDNKIDSAEARKNKAIKTKKISGIIAGASLFSAGFIPVVLAIIFSNLTWLPLVWLGVSLLSLVPSIIINTKKSNEAYDQQQVIKTLHGKKDRIIFEKSEKLHVLEMEMDLEYEILKKLQNEYTVLLKYARKKEPKKIEKAKIEVKKAKSFKEKVDKKIEEDSNLLK